MDNFIFDSIAITTTSSFFHEIYTEGRIIVDFNKLQIDGDITEVLTPNPIDKKFEAFNWNVININGHDFDEIASAFKQARECEDKPTVIIAHTVKGKDVSYMENNYAWHGAAPNEEQLVQALQEYGNKSCHQSNL